MASTAVAPSIVKSSPNKKQGPEKYEIESMVRTLMEAHDVQNDPEKMKHVSKHVRDQQRKLSSLQKRGLVSDKAASKMKGKPK
jgi:ribosomal protein S20